MKKTSYKYNHWIGFNDIPFIIIGTPLISILVTMIFFGINVHEAVLCFGLNVIPASISSLVFWIGDRFIIIYLRKKFPHHSDIRKKLYLQTLSILAYTAIMSIPLLYTEPLFDHSTYVPREHPDYLKSFVACLFATLPITAIYEAAFFINRWKMSIAETEKLKKENTQSQLEALKNQINPHFLFNSLNTLASIIPEDPKSAVDFVHKLSNVYRSVLDLKERTIVTLQEELEYLDNYNYLLKTRFGDNIHFEVDIHDACLSCYMVPLSMQMLVENAVKHNIVSQKKPLHILIKNEGEHTIIIQNNLQLKAQASEGTGTGLVNIENRYLLTFGKTISVVESDILFTIKLPLIPIQDYEGSHH